MLLGLGAIIFILDIFLHGECDVRIANEITTKIVIQFMLIGVLVGYVLIVVNSLKKIALSVLIFLPVLVMSRDLIEIRTYSFSISLLDLAVISASMIAIFVVQSKLNMKCIDRFNLILLAFAALGFLSIFVRDLTIGLSYLYSAFLIPLIYFILLNEMNLSKEMVVRTAVGFFLVSLAIFFLQNVYIGPMTVLQSSRNQTWLIDNVSIANGGLIEIGAMQAILIPIAFYIIYNELFVRGIFRLLHFRIVYLCALFVMVMPFIYNNRSNALLSIFLFSYFIYKKWTLGKIIALLPIIFPVVLWAIYTVVFNRSFVNDGMSINVVGLEISGINSTTFDHIQSTIAGFYSLAENLVFGVGPFVGANTWSESVFTIGNYRNYFFPIIELAVTNGILFFIVYFIFLLEIMRGSKDSLIKIYVLLPFIPILGASKFFGLYATGSLNLTSGFASLSDHTPVAIFSYGMVLLFLIGLKQSNEKCSYKSCNYNSFVITEPQGR